MAPTDPTDPCPYDRAHRDDRVDPLDLDTLAAGPRALDAYAPHDDVSGHERDEHGAPAVDARLTSPTDWDRIMGGLRARMAAALAEQGPTGYVGDMDAQLGAEAASADAVALDAGAALWATSTPRSA